MHTDYSQWPQEVSREVSARVSMGKAWQGAAVQAVSSGAGICLQHLGTCGQGEAAPPVSSQGMPPQKPGLVSGSFSVVTSESSRDNWHSDQALQED